MVSLSTDPESIGKSKTQGLDLEARADLTENLNISAGYSYMKSEVVKGTLRNGELN